MTITCIGNKKGIYINPVTLQAYGIDLSEAENFEYVDFVAVDHVIIRRNVDGTFWIVQTSGYTPMTGLFFRVYSKEENINAI